MRSLVSLLICLLAAVPSSAEQGAPYGPATPDPAVKDDRTSNLLYLPGYEVSSRADGLTTIFSVHNHSDRPASVLIEYFDTSGNLLVDQELRLGGKQTRTIDVRSIRGLGGGRRRAIRGRIQITQTAGGSSRAGSDLTGDYFFLDPAGNFATGDQLLRREDHCSSLLVRLLDFGSGAKLRLFSSRPQGDGTPTARFTVYNEAGDRVDSGELFVDEQIEILNARDLTPVRFGTLELQYLEGGGSLSVEYSASGRFSVAMNATCTGSTVSFECFGRRCPSG